MGSSASLPQRLVIPAALTLLAVYSCGTYGAGGYSSACTATTPGSMGTVGVPNTGFPPLEMVRSAMASDLFWPIVFLVLIMAGVVIMYLVQRRSKD